MRNLRLDRRSHMRIVHSTLRARDVRCLVAQQHPRVTVQRFHDVAGRRAHDGCGVSSDDQLACHGIERCRVALSGGGSLGLSAYGNHQIGNDQRDDQHGCEGREVARRRNQQGVELGNEEVIEGDDVEYCREGGRSASEPQSRERGGKDIDHDDVDDIDMAG